MQHRNVSFQFGVDTEDKVTIFTHEGEFDSHEFGKTYNAELYTTDQALIIKIKDHQTTFIATGLQLRDAITSGKPVWIAHLNSNPNYVLPKIQLSFDLIS